MKKIISTYFLASAIFSADAEDVAKFDSRMVTAEVTVTNGVKWVDGKFLPVEGKPFDESETETYFERLPKAAVGNEGVQAMKNHTTRMQLRFTTDSKRVLVKWKNDGCAFTHFTAIGRSGIDVYRLCEKTGKWRYVLSGWPNANVESALSCDWTPGEACLINLPLYNKVEYIKVGIDEGASFSAPPPYKAASKNRSFSTALPLPTAAVARVRGSPS